MSAPEIVAARECCRQVLSQLAIPGLEVEAFIDQETTRETWVTLVSSNSDQAENLCLNWYTLFIHVGTLEIFDLEWMADRLGLELSLGRETLARRIVELVEQRVDTALAQCAVGSAH